MFISKKHLSRRTLLKGAGAAIALPLLDAMIPASTALAQTWQADLLDIGFAGHINVASGFGPWPAALSLRDMLAQRAGIGQSRHLGLGGERAIA